MEQTLRALRKLDENLRKRGLFFNMDYGRLDGRAESSLSLGEMAAYSHAVDDAVAETDSFLANVQDEPRGPNLT